jgi:hypothetical protein
MSSDDTKAQQGLFALPGVVGVSAPALEMARKFDKHVKSTRSGDEWVIAFDWAISRGIRRRVDGPMEELGPGLDLVAFKRCDVPDEAVQHVEDVTFVIKTPGQVYEASSQRLIDVDEKAFSNLVLR